MTLAAILAVYILSLGWLSPSVPSVAAPVPQPQNQPAQSSEANQQPASPFRIESPNPTTMNDSEPSRHLTSAWATIPARAERVYAVLAHG